MINTNRDRLITMSVMGQVISPGYPAIPAIPHQIDKEGKPRLLPSLGGIVFNVKVGDPVFGWAGDNIEPGVAIKAPDAAANQALNVFACVGNEAVIMSGDAKGARGVVTGKSGRFSEHVIIDFAPDVLERLAFGDKIIVRAQGVGMTIDDFPGIHLKSLAPVLFDQLRPEKNNGKLTIPTTAIVPPELMGAGAGLTSDGGAICIQSLDQSALKKHGLDNLRLGDIVAISDYDSAYGHGYRKGGVSLGVVSSTDGIKAGYGPGVTLLMTAPRGEIDPLPVEQVNLTGLLKLPGRDQGGE
jgi:Domain of unknown function (DUF4438), N-terminal/Domain of unknown function (DUF4438), C-terminal